MAETTLKTRTISALIWKFLERFGYQAIQLVVQIVLARILAPEDFGMLAIIIVFVTVGNVFVTAGLSTALIQFEDTTDDDCSTIFWLCLAIAIVLYAFVFFFAPTLAAFYEMPQLIAPLRVLGCIPIINSLVGVQTAFVIRQLEMRKTFVATLLSVIVSGATGIIIATLGGGIWALVVQQVLYQLVSCLVYLVILPWKPRFIFHVHRAKQMFHYGWKLLCSALLDTGSQSLADLIIGKMFNETVLGFYSQGKKFPMTMGTLFDGTIQPVVFSALSKVQNSREETKALMRRALKTSTFVVVPVMACLLLVATPLVSFLLTDKWLPCVAFLQAYCLVYALLPLHTSNLQTINALGHSEIFLKLEIIKSSISIAILCVTVFVLQDVYCVAAGYVLSSLIATFINARPNKRLIGYGYLEQLRDIAPAYFLAIVAAAVALPLSFTSLPSLAMILLQFLIMCVVYFCLARLLKIEAYRYLKSVALDLIRSRGNAQAGDTAKTPQTSTEETSQDEG